MVWDPYMAGYNADYARTSINHGSAVLNSDGTITAVIALDQLDHPNSVSTIGHQEGVIAFRWFHPDAVPDTPTVELVSVQDAPRSIT